VGLRELKHDASTLFARVHSEDSIVGTDPGTLVARMMPVSELNIEGSIATGQATAANISVEEMIHGATEHPPITVLSNIFAKMRDDQQSSPTSSTLLWWSSLGSLARKNPGC